MWSLNPLFVKALWTALALGLLAPVIGRHLVLGRSVMMGLAVPQVAMAGVSFVMLGAGLGWRWCVALPSEPLQATVGALLFTFPALAIVSGLRRERSGASWEPVLAVLYLGAAAAINLMLSSHAFGEMYVEDLFHGRMLLINSFTMTVLCATLGLAAGGALLVRRRLLLVLTDPDFAAVCGVRVRAWRVGITLLNGSVIGVSVAAVGPNVTFGFLLLPALLAALWARSLRSHLLLSMAAGVALAFAGFHASYRWDLPLGDAIVALGCGLLVVGWGLARCLKGRRPAPAAANPA